MLEKLEELLAILEQFKGLLSPEDYQRFQAISAEVADLREGEKPETPQLGWYVGKIARIPTAYNDPFVVAVQARSREQACDRLRKIYSCGNYASPGAGAVEDSLSNTPVTDVDELLHAKKYPLMAS